MFFVKFYIYKEHILMQNNHQNIINPQNNFSTSDVFVMRFAAKLCVKFLSVYVILHSFS